MKKKILILAIALLAFIPTTFVKAEAVITNLAEAVEEEIAIIGTDKNYEDELKTLKKFDTKNYKASNDKVTVYIFRGNTCPHCLDAVVYFSSIYEKYKDIMDVKTYEVYGNTDNRLLMQKAGEILNFNTTGVPVLVIGETVFEGFNETKADEYIKTIEDYSKGNYIDAIAKINDGTYKAKDISKEKKSEAVGFIILVITVVIIIAILISRSKNTTYYSNED